MIHKSTTFGVIDWLLDWLLVIGDLVVDCVINIIIIYQVISLRARLFIYTIINIKKLEASVADPLGREVVYPGDRRKTKKRGEEEGK